MAIKSGFNLCSLRSVLISRLSNEISEVSSSSKRVGLGHFVPEDVTRMDLFPKIATIGLPVLHNPVKIVLDEWPDIVLSLVCFVGVHKDGTPL